MQKFTNLKQFNSYCKEVEEADNDLFLLSGLAFQMSKDELLDDIYNCLSVYYFWLQQSINEEKYEIAGQIVTSKNVEIEWYIEFTYAILKNNIKNEIIGIDNYLNDLYLSDGQ